MTARRIARCGVALLAGSILTTAFLLKLWPWQFHPSASDDEIARRMPGDNLILDPLYQTTRAITIHATPGAIFPWLLQIGQGRGGFYSFDRLENLIGLNIRSADRIAPEWQGLAAGDIVPLSPNGGPTVAAVEPDKYLVLHFVMDPFTAGPVDRGENGRGRWFDWTWTFDIRPVDERNTRLVIRTRADYAPHLLLTPLVSAFVKPTHFVMERAMLRGIKRRAERLASPISSDRVETSSMFISHPAGPAL